MPEVRYVFCSSDIFPRLNDTTEGKCVFLHLKIPKCYRWRSNPCSLHLSRQWNFNQEVKWCTFNSDVHYLTCETKIIPHIQQRLNIFFIIVNGSFPWLSFNYHFFRGNYTYLSIGLLKGHKHCLQFENMHYIPLNLYIPTKAFSDKQKP